MKEKILNFLRKEKEGINPKALSKRLKISYPTVLKYCDILYAEGKVDIKDYGNVKIVKIK